MTYRQDDTVLSLEAVFQTLGNIFEVLGYCLVGSLELLSERLQAPFAIGLPRELHL
jgi:hypothetical protein